MDTSDAPATCPHNSAFVDSPWAFRRQWLVRCGLCDCFLTEPRISEAEAEADERAWHAVPARFNIRWRQGLHGLGEYCVSTPEYAGGEVVDAAWHDQAVGLLAQQLRSALSSLREPARAQAQAALDRVDAVEAATRRQPATV
jgi:hypothetical protein